MLARCSTFDYACQFAGSHSELGYRICSVTTLYGRKHLRGLCLSSSLPSSNPRPIVVGPFPSRRRSSNNFTSRQPHHTSAALTLHAHNGQHKAIVHAGTRSISCDAAQIIALRLRTPPLTRHRCPLLYHSPSSRHPIRTAATQFPTTSTEAMGRGGGCIGPSGQVLLAPRDVPRHVCVAGAVFSPTVSTAN
jgi:hypothetical protein